jgi:predicted ATPase
VALALVGENGAGESTCVKMIGDVYQPALTIGDTDRLFEVAWTRTSGPATYGRVVKRRQPRHPLVLGRFRLYAEFKIEPKTGSTYTVKDWGM